MTSTCHSRGAEAAACFFRHADRLAPFRDLIGDEVNVHDVRLTTAVDEVAERVLTVVFKVAAPRLGQATQAVAAAAKRGQWKLLDDGRVQPCAGPSAGEA